MAGSYCISCLTEVSNFFLYICKSCVEKQSNFLCKDFIVPHIRKSQRIFASRGKNKPLICSTHSFVVSEYCKTCDVSFCSKCIANHRKHNCESVDDKASEVRAKVFNYVTDLKMQEKLLQLKNITNSELAQKNKDDARKFGIVVQNHCNRLAETELREVQEKSKYNKGQGEVLQHTCFEMFQMQKNVRELWSQPNSILIQNYASVFDKAEEFDLRYENCIKMKEKTVSLVLKISLAIVLKSLAKF